MFTNFETLSEISKLIDIHKSIYDEAHDFSNNEEFTRKVINEIKRNDKYSEYVDSISEIGELLDGIDGYFILTLFLINHVHDNEDVIWEYYDLVNGGWVEESEVEFLIGRNSRFLLITEGSSDTKILRNAFDWIYPDIASFFEFIDMDKNYPFTGVGNMANFYHGICKIGASKNSIFIFDNDTAGKSALKKCILGDQPNLGLLTLPDLPEFNTFRTIGPSGESTEDVNGRAVSIEMFLDLSYGTKQIPKVRWTSYDSRSDKYQGSLVDKEQYTKHFFAAFKKLDKAYSLVKLKALLDTIIEVASVL